MDCHSTETSVTRHHDRECIWGKPDLGDRAFAGPRATRASSHHFIGVVPPEQVREVIRQADVLLMASDVEGCPRAVLEAMAEAKPVIATKVDGLNEMIQDGRTGRLCPSGDLDLYSAAIIELAADEQYRRRLGLSGKTEGERRYNCDTVMSAYEDVYAEALARASSA